MNRSLAIVSLSLLSAGTAHAGVWGFVESDFNSSDWTNSTYTNDGDILSSVLHQPNGDPADNGYLSFEFQGESGSRAQALALYNGAIYDPGAEGAISQVTFNMNARILAPGNVTYIPVRLALEQDGVIFFSSAASVADEHGDWISVGESGVVAAEFIAYDLADGSVIEDVLPDFSSEGSEIRFGITHGYINGYPHESWVVRDFDDLTIRITNVPGPGAAGLGALGLLAAGRRKR